MGEAAAIYLQKLSERFGSHPLDNGKLTISSYSFDLIQRRLIKDKRPAGFIPNVRKAYGIIRGSAVGGLTSVFKHQCDEETAPPKTEDKEQSRVLSYDVNSLYGGSVRLHPLHANLSDFFLLLLLLLLASPCLAQDDTLTLSGALDFASIALCASVVIGSIAMLMVFCTACCCPSRFER